MKVLTEERQQYILKKIDKENTVKVTDLSKEMNCSISTVRRDLSELEDRGKLIRIHGGAKRVYTLADEMEIEEKSTTNIYEKSKIGKLAASFVEEEDVIYLDAGTTTYQMIPYLKDIQKLLVVTNGIKQADLLVNYGISTILIGGQIKKKTKAIIGSTAVEQLKTYYFNKSFLGINGIDLEFGYTTPDPEEAILKTLAAKLSSQQFILADQTKFGQVNFAKVGELKDFTIITDKFDDSQKNASKNKKRNYNKRTKILEAGK